MSDNTSIVTTVIIFGYLTSNYYRHEFHLHFAYIIISIIIISRHNNIMILIIINPRLLVFFTHFKSLYFYILPSSKWSISKYLYFPIFWTNICSRFIEQYIGILQAVKLDICDILYIPNKGWVWGDSSLWPKAQ